MIAFVEGIVDSMEADSCVIDVAGIGYEVYVSSICLSRLPGIGEPARLYTYLSVREDGATLYGFLSRDEQSMFQRLISVSGIGPKGALSILSIMDADSVRFAILSGDYKTIAKANGIGPKTAQRVILDLKDKVKLDDEQMIRQMQTPISVSDDTMTDAMSDAVSALISLGYTPTDSKKAISSIPDASSFDSGTLLSKALKVLY